MFHGCPTIGATGRGKARGEIDTLPPTIPQGENGNHCRQTDKGRTVATMTDKELGRVMSLLVTTWDKAADMATADGVPESDRGIIAGAVLDAFMTGISAGDTNPALAERCAGAYLAALTNYQNGGR